MGNNKWDRRDKKRRKRQYAMVMDNAGVRRIQLDLAHKRKWRRANANSK